MPSENGRKDTAMMVLVIGGSGSGKSAWAESYMALLPETKYYLATMCDDDMESKRRIERHREQRRGKGFLTIEQPVDIWKAAEQMENERGAALLECISNLTANEMFAGPEPVAEETVAGKIVSEIAGLKEKLTHFVIVSNNVFEDGRVYDDTTMAYIRAMGWINGKLAVMADAVVEVVAGIPVMIKERQEGRNGLCTS